MSLSALLLNRASRHRERFALPLKRIGESSEQPFLHGGFPVLTLFFGMALRASASGSFL